MKAVRFLWWLLVAVMMFGLPLGVAWAGGNEEKTSKPPEERYLWRLEWDNDAFVRVDNGFTNGWSIQRHPHQHDAWHEMGPSKFSAWISRTIPGLDDDGSRIVKRGTGLSAGDFSVGVEGALGNRVTSAGMTFESVNPITDLTWGNITFEYRF